MSDYDPQNVFAKILKGDIPSHKLFENDHVLAIMDVMPQSTGHALVIPKSPSRNILDASPESLGHAIRAVQNLAKASKEAFSADGVMIVQYNEAPAGQSVFHLHFHVIPRFEGVALRGHSGKMEDQSLLAEHAARIRAALERSAGLGEYH